MSTEKASAICTATASGMPASVAANSELRIVPLPRRTLVPAARSRVPKRHHSARDAQPIETRARWSACQARSAPSVPRGWPPAWPRRAPACRRGLRSACAPADRGARRPRPRHRPAHARSSDSAPSPARGLLAAVELQFGPASASSCDGRSSCATISVTSRRGRSEGIGRGLRDAVGGSAEAGERERHHGGQCARMRMPSGRHAPGSPRWRVPAVPTNSIQFLPNASARVHPGLRWGVHENPWRPPNEPSRPFGREENHGAV